MRGADIRGDSLAQRVSVRVLSRPEILTKFPGEHGSCLLIRREDRDRRPKVLRFDRQR